MIVLLVGCISSGKSTWSRKRASEGWITINDDNIITLLHGGDYTLYNKALKPFYKSIESHILHMAVAMGLNVIVDKGVNISRRARSRWIALAKSLDTPIEARVFPKFSPEIHAKKRFESDARGKSYKDWLEAAQKHEKEYEIPTVKEGFTRIVSSDD
jgi:predicted kinase